MHGAHNSVNIKEKGIYTIPFLSNSSQNLAISFTNDSDFNVDLGNANTFFTYANSKL